MGTRKTTERRGSGPAGPSGRRGTRGAAGLVGRQGPRGQAGPVGERGPDHRALIEALDAEVHGIYRELSAHMDHLTRVQRQLDEMRRAIKKLGASITD
jgi:hypothetical protein